MSLKNLRVLGVFVLSLVLAVAGFTPAASAPSASASLPKVAIYNAGGTVGTNADVVAKLTATGMFSQVDDLSPLDCNPFDPYNGLDATPSLATLQEYAAILVYSNCSFNDPVALGDVLADYVDAGGTVVVAAFSFWEVSAEIGLYGRLLTDGYLPLTLGTQGVWGDLFLVPDLPDDPLLAGVTSFNGGPMSLRNSGISLTPGATLVAHWSDGTPLVAYKGNVVALNFFPRSSDSYWALWDAQTDGARLMANALYKGLSTVLEVSIDIKPGSLTNPIKLSSTGTTPVAILSTIDFDAPAEVDRSSVTFGRTGDEGSLVACNPADEDANLDGLLDLVCHFRTGLTGFQLGDTLGILKGATLGGNPIEGSDVVRISK
jgi:hypothetical protein